MKIANVIMQSPNFFGIQPFAGKGNAEFVLALSFSMQKISHADTNSTADPDAKFEDEIWYIDRVASDQSADGGV